ncbi:MAG: 23S rRNA (pseudouridine(1915)-N(3))-methyltransferase RlmH [Deltaproteobacteria bacterium]|nr:MAG: 23S rRNA (pseudouridine(1915)-N(3))-methyltransferase RlmH [Deltaproteobacteria bacterium]
MKLRLLCVGRLSHRYLNQGCDDYLQRLRRYLPTEVVELKEDRSADKVLPERVREREGEVILSRIRTPATVWALDEHGRQLDSPGLARLIEQEMTSGCRHLDILIGGAYGLSRKVLDRADRVLSLSKLTFTHQMARLIALEQLYRGLTIIRNEPYHNA